MPVDMSLQEKLKEEMKSALRGRETVRLSVLRGILSAFTNELVAKKRKPDEEIEDELALEVISRQAKQRKDSIEQFRKGGRVDLAEEEEAELKIIEEYLPKQMSEEEVKKIALKKKEEMGDKVEMGKLMGALMQELKGKADGGVVKKVVDEILS
jgi:uncharacterized protein YqeY